MGQEVGVMHSYSIDHDSPEPSDDALVCHRCYAVECKCILIFGEDVRRPPVRYAEVKEENRRRIEGIRKCEYCLGGRFLYTLTGNSTFLKVPCRLCNSDNKELASE